MLLPAIRTAALAAAFSFASLAASAQSFGEFIKNTELPVTFLGVDFSTARYYGPPLTVDQGEMKEQFTKINELLENESEKYDLAKALHRTVPTKYAIYVAEKANQKIDPSTIIVPSSTPPRAPFTSQNVQEQVSSYTYPAGSSGVGLVFVVESLKKGTEEEIFWAVFVDMSTKQVLYSGKTSGSGAGFGFRNHWAHPLYAGIQSMKYNYAQWKKKYAKG